MNADVLAKAVGCHIDRAAKWLPFLVEAMARFGIEGVNEQASFIAQLSHESAKLSTLVENLNYSADGLAKTWPKRYATNGRPNQLAVLLARRPQAIANNCYAMRMGNGDVASGDGWKFRGRGPIQITGRRMYALCGEGIGADLINNPDLLLEPKYGALSAGWFWNMSGLDRFDDDEDVLAETKIINGGTNGIKERDDAFKRALAALKGNQ